jgi:hypothetical protein
MARFEWAICEVLVLAVLICELVSIRRTLRRDREARRAEEVERRTPV